MNTLFLIFIIFLLIFIASCSGGGGGGDSDTPNNIAVFGTSKYDAGDVFDN